MLTRFALPALALGTLLVFATGAAAHVTTPTEDEAYFITTGQQGEPVYTFQTTNLDLIVRVNDDGERGDEVTGVHETVNATLIGPGGERLSDTLTTQFGAEGRYEFENGYALTRPGVYTLELEGMIGDTDVSGTYEMPGPIEDQSDVMFPDQGLPTLRELQETQDRVDALESQVASLQDELEQSGDDSEQAPAPGALLLVGLLAALVFAARRVRQ